MDFSKKSSCRLRAQIPTQWRLPSAGYSERSQPQIIKEEVLERKGNNKLLQGVVRGWGVDVRIYFSVSSSAPTRLVVYRKLFGSPQLTD